MGAARVRLAAESAEEFQGLMQQPDQVDEWFVPQLIGDLIVSGKRLSTGQCYSYKLPPMLNGKMELDNFEPTDLLVHCSMFGQVGRKIQHLPEGTKIDGFTTVNDD
ncbi:T6SS immunity protein Tdi1 domain-containing protein [Haloferula sp. BvORR071]|uniref:T6SS immunity protein Tdi1 domain-containing protein n=1 Tax=Haloferula sp. BvORR071 TaxID=1396141 RepID=UPI000695D3C4|nr:T6SS immunity protein Tdi1 domain-containing protein [Haloferula sp. BvORR071]